MALSSELRAWIVPGLAGTIASVDLEGQPQIVRVWAARPGLEPDDIDICVHAEAASSLLAALAKRPRVGLNLIEVMTYRSRLFKGSCRLVQQAIDGAWLEDARLALNEVFLRVGMGPRAVERMLAHSLDPHAMVALRVTVEHAFDQSPKPGAGVRL